MDQYYEGIKKGEYNLVLLDQNGTQGFSATASPVTKLSQLIVRGLLPDEYTVYTTQLGLALATVSRMIKIKKIIAVAVSQPGKELLDAYGVDYTADLDIYLVKDSKNPDAVCGIEKALLGMDTEAERIAFIASKGKESAPSCPVK
jgi:hypothetical protein